MNIDLEEVSAFLRVVETRSFTRAAELLGVSKSSVSRRIAQLEERLGARLLSRTTRQVALTEVGELYYERASKAVHALDDAARSVSALQDEARGHLRLTAPADFVTALASLLPAFSARYPSVTVEVVFAQRVLDIVAEGMDLAIRAGALADSSLIARKVAATSLKLYASPAYLHASGTPKTLAELAEHQCVLFRSGGNEQRWQLNGPDGPEEIDVKGRLAGDGYDFLKRVLIGGGGIGMLPSILASPAVARGDLAAVLPSLHGEESGLYVVYPPGKYVSAKVRVFRDFCVDWFADPPADV